MALFTCGHKIPDSDSIVSAISLSYLLEQLGKTATPVRQGELNPESQFILNEFGFDKPILKTSFANDELFLTDFSDIAQAPDDIDKATIVGIVDHHKLGDLTTSAPLEAWIRPVGCTNTIIKEMYDYHKIDIPSNIASIMLCAILSDTVIFKSPTCTPVDIQAVKELAKIAKIDDYLSLGMKMFEIKSEVKGAPIRELILRDFKDFTMGDKKIGIGQLEVIDVSIFNDMKDNLLKDMNTFKIEGNRDTVLLLLTDIMKEGSELLIASDSLDIIESAFKLKSNNNSMWLDGVLSRKKQIVPVLEPLLK